MDKRDEELINHLAEKLKSHELPYKEGAWEKFAASQKSLPKGTNVLRLLSPWTAVAAAVILMATAGLYYFNQQGGENTITKTRTRTALNQNPVAVPAQTPALQVPSATDNKDRQDPGVIATGKTGAENTMGAETSSVDNTAGGTSIAGATALPIPAMEQDLAYRKIDPQHLHTISAQVAKNGISATGNINLLSGIERLQPGIKPVAQPITGSAALASGSNTAAPKGQLPVGSTAQKSVQGLTQLQLQQTDITARQQDIAAGNFDDKGYIDPDAPGARQNKWDMGLMVIPAMGNDSKLNLGYGVNVGYRLSNRLSLNSGVAYSAMSGSKNVSPEPGITSGARTLSSIDANVTGVNVPLELRYNVSQKIYVGAGVSALAVISNKQDLNYAINQLQSTAFVSKNGNLLNPQQVEALTSGIKTKEAIPDADINSKNFAGFLNFSFGFKQKLNKSKSLSIEPFMSVPMSNNLSNQNIRLTDGGIRIKIGL